MPRRSLRALAFLPALVLTCLAAPAQQESLQDSLDKFALYLKRAEYVNDDRTTITLAVNHIDSMGIELTLSMDHVNLSRRDKVKVDWANVKSIQVLPVGKFSALRVNVRHEITGYTKSGNGDWVKDTPANIALLAVLTPAKAEKARAMLAALLRRMNIAIPTTTHA